MSDYRFQVVRQSVGTHEVARDKSRVVAELFIEQRKGFTFTEHVASEEVTEFIIKNNESIVVGQLFVLINSVLFFIFGTAAVEEAWNMEGDMVDLMDHAFPTASAAENL